MTGEVAFLRARLDEDEAAAKAWLPFGNPDSAQREHIARHDPARVLREVAAKRAILALHQPYTIGLFGSRQAPRCEVCLSERERYPEFWEGDPWPCATVRVLLAEYSDREDYDPAWMPAGEPA